MSLPLASRARRCLCVPAVIFLFASVASAAEPAKLLPESAPLSASGDAGKSWTTFHGGDTLPAQCQLRTATGAASEVEINGATLRVDCDSRLQFDRDHHKIMLETGRLFFVGSDSRQAWTLAVGKRAIKLAQQSRAEATIEKDGQLRLAVVAGTAEIGLTGAPNVIRLAARQTCRVATEKAAANEVARGLSDDELAAIEAWTKPARPTQGLGQLVIQDAQSGAATRLNVSRYHVNVVLQPPVALVQIDQSFYNPSRRQEEGTFVFNLPRGASVSRFAMYVAEGNLIEGELIERAAASKVYESIVRQQRDPAILEQLGDNLFKMRVFPIPSFGSKRILLDFTLPLAPEAGRYRLRLPLLSDLQPIWDCRLSGSIRGTTLLESCSSLSHPEMKFTRDSDDAIHFDWQRRWYQPASDLVVNFTQPAATKPVVRSYRAKDLPAVPDAAPPQVGKPAGSYTYFAVTLPNPTPGAALVPADVLILADTSASSREELPRMREVVRTVVHNLPVNARVRIACVDVALRPLDAGWLAPDSVGAAATLAEFDRQFCMGGANLVGGFAEALKSFESGEKSPRRKLIVYIGAGKHTLEQAHDEKATRNQASFVPAANQPIDGKLIEQLNAAHASLVSAIVADDPVGSASLIRASVASGGTSFDFHTSSDAAQSLMGWALAGAPTRGDNLAVKVDGCADEDLFLSREDPAIGGLRICGRVPTEKQPRLRLTTQRDGEPLDLSLAGSPDDVFVGRLWAQRKLDQLNPALAVESPPGANRDATAPSTESRRAQIVALSQEWSLMSPLTAFLVLENEAEYDRYHFDRRQRRQYWKPAGSGPQPSPAADWTTRASDEFARARERQTFDAALADAQRLIADGKIAAAARRLKDAQRSPLAKESAQWKQLYEKSHAMDSTFFAGAFDKSTRRLLDWDAQGVFLRPQFDLMPLATGVVNESFLERHPQGLRLLQDVELPKKAQTLRQFAAKLGKAAGVAVAIDGRSLEGGPFGQPGFQPRVRAPQRTVRPAAAETPAPTGDEIADDMRIEPIGQGRMSWFNYARTALAMHDLVFVEHPHQIEITRVDAEGNLLDTRVLPVADLFLSDRAASPADLIDPLSDREELAATRIRHSLEKRVDVDFDASELHKVLDFYAGQLDNPLVIDQPALNAARVATTAPVTADWSNMSLDESLRAILRPLDLTYCIRHEALCITSSEQAASFNEVRLYPGRGLLFQLPRPNGQGGAFGSAGGFGGGGFGAEGHGIGGGAGFGGRTAAGAQGASTGGLGGGGATGGAVNSSIAISALPEPANPVAVPDAAFGKSSLPAEEPSSSETVDNIYPAADSIIDLITSSVWPASWDGVGGAGDIKLFPYTLDLVVSNTADAHAEIGRLLERLRRLPVIGTAKSGIRPAQIPHVTADNLKDADVDALSILIQSVVQPNRWDNVGGMSSIGFDLPHMALVISATPTMHDEISRLLTLFRRSRYSAAHGGRPWEIVSLRGAFPRLVPNDDANLLAEKLAPLAPPSPEQLALLKARREFPAGRTVWKCYDGRQQLRQSIGLSRSAAAAQLELHGYRVRLDASQAVVEYPELEFAERGPWAAGFWQLADLELPWLPHRSNSELAGMFAIEALAAPAVADADLVRLRLRRHGQSPDVYADVSFSRKTGQPVGWSEYAGGSLAYQMRFEPGVVSLEDGAGKLLRRWKAGIAGEKANVLALDQLPLGYLELGGTEHKAGDPELSAALANLQRQEWAAAAASFKRALAAKPDHKGLLLAWALCADRDPHADAAEEFAALTRVAGKRSPACARFLLANTLTKLTVNQRYTLLQSQPVESRTAEDLRQLALAAAGAHAFDEAAKHAESALKAAVQDAASLALNQTLIEVLLQADRKPAALKAAQDWAAAEKPAVAELLQIAGLLTDYNDLPAAQTLLADALALPNRPLDERLTLTQALADVEQGYKRLRRLLQFAELSKNDLRARREASDRLVDEIQDIADADRLAQETHDRELRATLLRQFVLFGDNAVVASNVIDSLERSGDLSSNDLPLAVRRYVEAERAKDAIALVEKRLLRGEQIPAATLLWLRAAYTTVHRTADALRAETDQPNWSYSQSPGAGGQ